MQENLCHKNHVINEYLQSDRFFFILFITNFIQLLFLNFFFLNQPQHFSFPIFLFFTAVGTSDKNY